MSIFSSITSAVKKVGTAIGNTVAKFTGGNSNSGAAFNATVGQNVPSYAKTTSANTYPGFNAPSGTRSTTTYPSVASGNASFMASNPQYGYNGAANPVALPVTISSSKTSSGGGGSVLGATTQNYSPSAFSAPITTRSLSAAGTTQGAVQGGGGVNAGGTFSSSPYAVPQQYKSTDPGSPNTTGLAGSMAGYYTRKDDGTFEPVTQDPFAEKSDAAIAKEKAQMYKDAFGEPQSVYNDPEVQRAQAERRAAQQALQAPTAQLNAVLAQAQRDTLQLRQTAQKEGVVEAVYGNQASAINYNAAIAALPLQSNIAALQGNLELADSYLNELVTMKKEQIKTQYDYNKGLFDTIYSALDAKEKRVADSMVKENDRQYKSENDLIDYKAQLIASINSQGGSDSHVRITAVERAKDKASAARAAGDLTSVEQRLANQKAQNALNTQSTSTRVLDTLPTSIQGKVISMANSFGDKPQIKKYIEAVDSVNIVNGIDSKSKNPADHQQIVYAFAKALDPDSAVREGEYATIKKYAQGAASRYGKEISNAIAGTGFLSEAAITNIKTTIANTLKSRKPGYDNTLKETARVINNVAGSNVADELLMDYSGGVNSQSSGDIDYTATLDSIFN